MAKLSDFRLYSKKKRSRLFYSICIINIHSHRSPSVQVERETFNCYAQTETPIYALTIRKCWIECSGIVGFTAQSITIPEWKCSFKCDVSKVTTIGPRRRSWDVSFQQIQTKNPHWWQFLNGNFHFETSETSHLKNHFHSGSDNNLSLKTSFRS